MISVVCWKWNTPNYRSTYQPETVNVLRAMVRRHYPDPHRFICVTDDPVGLDADIEIVPIWDDLADVPHPHNPLGPSCYRRLKAFAPEMREILGKRFVSIDLDCVIVDDVRPLWNRPEEFVIWGGTTKPVTSYNGSMFLMTAGSRARVWKDFNPRFSPVIAKREGFYGSDQAWIRYVLGGDEARWTTKDGVYSYRQHIAPSPQCGRIPKDARIVLFNGKRDPWSPEIKGYDWVQEHYRP